jgi:hypothetical protein
MRAGPSGCSRPTAAPSRLRAMHQLHRAGDVWQLVQGCDGVKRSPITSCTCSRIAVPIHHLVRVGEGGQADHGQRTALACRVQQHGTGTDRMAEPPGMPCIDGRHPAQRVQHRTQVFGEAGEDAEGFGRTVAVARRIGQHHAMPACTIGSTIAARVGPSRSNNPCSSARKGFVRRPREAADRAAAVEAEQSSSREVDAFQGLKPASASRVHAGRGAVRFHVRLLVWARACGNRPGRAVGCAVRGEVRRQAC